MTRPHARRKVARALVALVVVAALVQCASSDVDTSEPLNPATDMGAAGMDLANAQRMYLKKCAMCHGENGEPVLVTAPDLRTSTMSVEERVAIIAYGKGTMPPHSEMLDMPTIRGIAVYIEKFRD